MSNSQKTHPDSKSLSSGAKTGSGSKNPQPGASSFKSDQSDHSNKRTFNEESERTELHKSSFKSARSLFESKRITGAKLSQTEKLLSTTSNSSVMRSFQTVNQKVKS